MKKIFLTIIFMLFATCSYAADNYLNTVILEGVDGGYNIILRSDAIASVKRTVESDDKITLNIKGLVASDNITTLYRNTSAANGIIVENVNSNEVSVQVQGDNVSKANIIFDSPASAPIVVSEGISKRTVWWTLFALVTLCFLFAKSKSLKVDSRDKIRAGVARNMRDREIALYKNYRRELLAKPSIDYKISNPRMKEAIKRADTIRHIQRTTKV